MDARISFRTGCFALTMLESDEKWMRAAIAEARKAAEIDEVPVGAVVISVVGDLIAAAFNRSIIDMDPTAHAEILALREAAKRIGNFRLTGATVYSTIEPCAMCAGALVTSRVGRLVYGAEDERFGAVKTNFGIGISPALNHRFDVDSGVLADECRELMQQFFRSRRL